MKILYISSLCSIQRSKEMNMYFKEKLLNMQAQKFHKLMIQGMVNNGCKIEHLTTCSHLSRFINKRYIKSSVNNCGGIKFYNLPVLSIPLVQFIFASFSTFLFVFYWIIKNISKEKIIIFDIIEVFHTFGGLIAAKILKVKTVAIVTDLPGNLVGANSSDKPIKNLVINVYKLFANKITNMHSVYIVITKQMNEVVNKRNRPNVIIEGIVDKKMNYEDNTVEFKYEKKVILFAGMLEEIHGIKMLVEAFNKTLNVDYELHIYGKGSAEEFIISMAEVDKRIKYFGLVSNEVVVKEEIKATLLINPRLTNQYFTQYSFPSKNMEYMASGTPLLTTALPGMPEEYYSYVYIINNETVEGLRGAIESILSKPQDELHQVGLNAKKFVLSNKDYDIQSKKIIQLIK